MIGRQQREIARIQELDISPAAGGVAHGGSLIEQAAIARPQVVDPEPGQAQQCSHGRFSEAAPAHEERGCGNPNGVRVMVVAGLDGDPAEARSGGAGGVDGRIGAAAAKGGNEPAKGWKH